MMKDENNLKTNTGWQCPKCGKINSPYVKHCECTKSTVTENGKYTPTSEDGRTILTEGNCFE